MWFSLFSHPKYGWEIMWTFSWITNYSDFQSRLLVLFSGWGKGPISISFCLRNRYVLSDFTADPSSFCQILTQNSFLSVRFYLRTLKFLSDFSSESPRYCQILPQNPLDTVRFYLRTFKFLSVYLRNPSFQQILPQNALVLSDFTAEPSSFCKMLPQNILCSVRNCLRIS